MLVVHHSAAQWPNMPPPFTLYRIQEKLGVKNKQELVIWAVRNGLLDDVAVGRDSHPVQEES